MMLWTVDEELGVGALEMFGTQPVQRNGAEARDARRGTRRLFRLVSAVTARPQRQLARNCDEAVVRRSSVRSIASVFPAEASRHARRACGRKGRGRGCARGGAG
jgi:hypothetical protein